MYPIFIILSLVEEHLDCFDFLAISITEQVSVEYDSELWARARSGMVGSDDILMVMFGIFLTAISRAAAPVCSE